MDVGEAMKIKKLESFRNNRSVEKTKSSRNTKKTKWMAARKF